jgi:hypothetical protein
MNTDTRRKIELLARNRELLSKRSAFNHGLMLNMAALILTGADKEADVDKIIECRKILRKNTGLFSSFRGRSEMALISKMALARYPEKYIRDVKEAYTKISKGRFAENSYLITAASALCDQGRADNMDKYIDKFDLLYKKMKKAHPFLTYSDDIPLAMLLSLTDKSVDEIVSDIETGYSYLKNRCRIPAGSDPCQAMSEVLAVTGGDMRAKCDKAVRFYYSFYSHKARYSSSHEFGSIATLIDINADTDDLVEEVIEVAEELRHIKGFGFWNIDHKMRLMFAALLVRQAYGDKISSVSNTVANAVAEEIVVTMIISEEASAAAAASAAY